MKLKLKFMIVLLFLLFTLSQFKAFLPIQVHIQNSLIQKNENKKIVYLSRNGLIEEIELETYLLGVVPSEMPISFELEALKAQAVAARSFVVSRNYQVDDTILSQVYKDEDTLRVQWQDQFDVYYEKVKKAVFETKGEVLMYEGAIAKATFFSSSNGYTNNAADYWVSAIPYLVSVESSWDLMETDNLKTHSFTWSEVEALLGKVNHIEIMSFYENGYVKEVLVNDQYYSGREIRELFQLSSSSFQIILDEASLIFETRGSGHGVGMSQYGALGMAKEGYTYRQILQHYYQGVEIVGL